LQEESERLFNVAPRLEFLRSRLGLTWNDLSEQLGVSRVMLHYLRKGKKPLGVKLDFRIRQLEERVSALSSGVAHAVPHPKRLPTKQEKWMQTLKRRWTRSKASRDEIRLAIRVLYPNDADDILAWLQAR
jgi:transcriptional regulator with XRE-family HTH domain